MAYRDLFKPIKARKEKNCYRCKNKIEANSLYFKDYPNGYVCLDCIGNLRKEIEYFWKRAKEEKVSVHSMEFQTKVAPQIRLEIAQGKHL